MPESRLERTRQAYRPTPVVPFTGSEDPCVDGVGLVNRATEWWMVPYTPETAGLSWDEKREYAKAHAASGMTAYSGPR